jgi:hypothetical protein
LAAGKKETVIEILFRLMGEDITCFCGPQEKTLKSRVELGRLKAFYF